MVIAHEFDYRRPASLEEAIGILAEYPGSAWLLAGGTDLVAWLRDDAVAPDIVVDIKDVPGLNGISVEDDVISIGSLATFTELIESDLVREHAPLLVEMAETVASTGIRNRATMVGNICSAVPSCDTGLMPMPDVSGKRILSYSRGKFSRNTDRNFLLSSEPASNSIPA